MDTIAKAKSAFYATSAARYALQEAASHVKAVKIITFYRVAHAIRSAQNPCNTTTKHNGPVQLNAPTILFMRSVTVEPIVFHPVRSSNSHKYASQLVLRRPIK